MTFVIYVYVYIYIYIYILQASSNDVYDHTVHYVCLNMAFVNTLAETIKLISGTHHVTVRAS